MHKGKYLFLYIVQGKGGGLQGGRSAPLRSAPPCPEVENGKKSQKDEKLNICKDKKQLKHARQLRKRREKAREYKYPYRREQESNSGGDPQPPNIIFFCRKN